MSSIAQVKTLLTQIRSQLGSAAGVDEESIEAFGALCRDARTRLEECDRLSAAGNLEKAVRLAEQEPELIELADRLADFETAPGWTSFASRSGLPEVPALGTGTADRLLQLYRSWDKSSEFLWRKYRATMMRRDEDAAVTISQRIFRLDPSDQDARDEVNRVGRRIFKERVKQLEEDVACGNQAAAIALVTQLDRIPFDDLKVGTAWETAVGLRDAQLRETNRKQLAGLVAALPGLRESQNLEELQRVVSQAQDLVGRLALDPGAEGRRQISESNTWIREWHQRQALSAKLGAALERCRAQVSKIEVSWGHLKSGPNSEAENALRKLNNCWSEVESAGSDPGAELRNKVASWRQKLESKIARAAGRAKRRTLLTKVAIGSVVFAAAYYLYAQWRGGRIKDNLAELQSERKALSVKAALDRAEKWSWPVIILARIRPEVDRSQAWYGREERHRRSVAALATGLEGSMVEDFEGPATTEFHKQMEALKREIADAAVDLQPGLNRGAASLFEKWDAHVEAFVADRQQKREAVVTEINASLDNMPALSEAGRDETIFPALEEASRKLKRWSEVTIPQADPRPEIAEQMRTVRPPLDRALESLKSFRQSLSDLQNATRYTAYLSAIGRFNRSGLLVQTPEHTAAAAMLASDPNELKITGQILAPSDPAGWDWFAANRNKKEFFPDSIEESERQVLKSLNDDKNLAGIYSCHFRERPSGKSIYTYSSGPPVEVERSAGDTTVIDQVGIYFDGAAFRLLTYSLESGRGEQLVGAGLSSESTVFEKIRPGTQLMSRSQQYYQQGFFSIFEQVIAAGNTEALFRAYLQSKLGSVFLKRPHEWGSVLSPQLISDLQALKDLGARSLVSGAWLTPDRDPELNQTFREFYAQHGHHRYALEAKLNRRLIERALEIGIGYAGFVDIDGSLILVPGLDEDVTELYGHSDPKLPAKLLFRRTAQGAAGIDPDAEPGLTSRTGDPPDWTPLADGAALTALFYFKGDRAKVIEEIAAELEIPAETARSIGLTFFGNS